MEVSRNQSLLVIDSHFFAEGCLAEIRLKLISPWNHFYSIYHSSYKSSILAQFTQKQIEILLDGSWFVESHQHCTIDNSNHLCDLSKHFLVFEEWLWIIHCWRWVQLKIKKKKRKKDKHSNWIGENDKYPNFIGDNANELC